MIPTDIMDTIIKGREFYKEYTDNYKRQKGVTEYVQTKFKKLGRTYKTNYIRLICHYGKVLEESGYIEVAMTGNWDAKKVDGMVRMYTKKEIPKYSDLLAESQRKIDSRAIKH